MSGIGRGRITECAYMPAIHLRGRRVYPAPGRVNEVHVPFKFSREDVMSHLARQFRYRATEIADVTLVRDSGVFNFPRGRGERLD